MLIVNAYYRYYPITLLLYLMCAYCQCLLPLLPYYLITLPNVCLLSMLITFITYYLVTLANVCLLSMLITIITLLPYYFT